MFCISQILKNKDNNPATRIIKPIVLSEESLEDKKSTPNLTELNDENNKSKEINGFSAIERIKAIARLFLPPPLKNLSLFDIVKGFVRKKH